MVQLVLTCYIYTLHTDIKQRKYHFSFMNREIDHLFKING
jgi:hypothetical protein